jgi:hypothetical protein
MAQITRTIVGALALPFLADAVQLRAAEPMEEMVAALPTPLPNSQNDIFMHYMPEQNMAVCGCGKCGTSSMYEYIYNKSFGHTFNYTDEPWVQEVESSRWEGKFEHITDHEKQEKLMNSAYTYALIRDPKERIISSWKSKIACCDWYHPDYDRSTFVRNLRALAALKYDESLKCQSLDDFLETMATIHRAGNAKDLDRHFLPQDLGCFSRFGAKRWTKVTVIQAEGSFDPISHHLHVEPAAPPHDHGSDAKILISAQAAKLLDEITKDEYDMLRDYLPDNSTVTEGEWVMRMHDNEPKLKLHE